ncbi:MAG: hypothetical protein OHK0057_02370 [Thermoflexibacter sp.]
MKYKLNINKPKIEEKEIEEFKNFHRVLRQYREKRRSKSLHNVLLRLNKQLPILIISILMVLLIIYFSTIIKKVEKIEQKNLPQQEQK